MSTINFKSPSVSVPVSGLDDDPVDPQTSDKEVERSSRYLTRWNSEIARTDEIHPNWYAEPDVSVVADLSAQQRELLGPHAALWESWRRELGNALKYAVPVAASMGAGHAVELWVFKQFATNVLARALAVSLPYVFGATAEPPLRRALGHDDVAAQQGVVAPWENTAASALINWNVAQPAVDKVLEGHRWLRTAKLLTTAAINGARGVVDYASIQRAMSQLPSDALPPDRQLTATESLVVALMVNSLRSVFDVMRQSCKVAQSAGVVLPAGGSLPNRALVSPHYGGGVPALVQPVKANAGDDVTRQERDTTTPALPASLQHFHDSMNPFA